MGGGSLLMQWYVGQSWGSCDRGVCRLLNSFEPHRVSTTVNDLVIGTNISNATIAWHIWSVRGYSRSYRHRSHQLRSLLVQSRFGLLCPLKRGRHCRRCLVQFYFYRSAYYCSSRFPRVGGLFRVPFHCLGSSSSGHSGGGW